MTDRHMHSQKEFIILCHLRYIRDTVYDLSIILHCPLPMNYQRLLIDIRKRATFEYSTPLALFGGSLRIGLQLYSHEKIYHTDNSSIRSMTCFPPNKAILCSVVLGYRPSKDSLMRTCWIFELLSCCCFLHPTLRLESYSFE